MGMLTITTNGSFGNTHKVFKSQTNGHAHAIAEAIEYLSSELLPEAIAQDHELHASGGQPEDGFRRKT